MNEVLFELQSPRRRRRVAWKKMLWSAAGSVALGGLYSGRLEEGFLRIERRRMTLPGLGQDLSGVRLVHISDLHSSPLVRERYLRGCVEEINALQPDFVAITGDFITGPKGYARRVARVLSHLRPRVASLACLGNHDYGLFHPTLLGDVRGMADYVADQLAYADVFVMRNESRTFSVGGSAIQFVGVEDYWSRYYNPYRAFEMANPRAPTVALCHNPDASRQLARCGAGWVLSGHTHGSGTPDTRFHDLVLPTGCKGFAAGQYDLGDGKHLYVNRGLGYARRMNLNGRPEITLFTLEPATAP